MLNFSAKTDNRGTRRTAQIPGKRQQSEHRRSALGQPAARLSVPGHIMPTDNPHRPHPIKQVWDMEKGGKHIADNTECSRWPAYMPSDLAFRYTWNRTNGNIPLLRTNTDLRVLNRFDTLSPASAKSRCPLVHCHLRSARTYHHKHKQPKNPCQQQLSYGHTFAVFIKSCNRNPGIIECVEQRNTRPYKCKNPPVLNPENSKKQCGTQDNQNMPPAVEGMEQAHDSRLILRWACLNYRAG